MTTSCTWLKPMKKYLFRPKLYPFVTEMAYWSTTNIFSANRKRIGYVSYKIFAYSPYSIRLLSTYKEPKTRTTNVTSIGNQNFHHSNFAINDIAEAEHHFNVVRRFAAYLLFVKMISRELKLIWLHLISMLSTIVIYLFMTNFPRECFYCFFFLIIIVHVYFILP